VNTQEKNESAAADMQKQIDALRSQLDREIRKGAKMREALMLVRDAHFVREIGEEECEGFEVEADDGTGRPLICVVEDALGESEESDESDSLKPCPFCGAPAHVVHFGSEYIVECKFCEASTVSGGSRERSIRIWNSRAPS